MINVEKTLNRQLPSYLRNSLVSKILSYGFSNIIKEKEINQFIQDNLHLKGYDFIEAVLDYFQFSYQISARDKESIATTGRCLIVANHPLGALDSLSLLHMVLNVRSDVRIVANEILSNLGSLDDYLLPINNIAGESSRKRMMAISRALESEQAVIIFPAGEVSRSYWFKIRDRSWGKGFYLFAKRTKCDIIPIFISGKNSFWFYAWSKISPLAALLLLPRQMWQQKNKVITLKVGTALPFALLNKMPIDDNQKVRLLRRHIYQLGKNRSGIFSVPHSIAHPERRSDLRLAISDCQVLGCAGENQQILLFDPKENSPLLRELGRLRELTFRQVGEGTGNRRDLDRYDGFYKHIIIWNDIDLEIMGAYRIAPCQMLLSANKLPLQNLYTNSLFDYRGQLDWLNEGLELGRSFVQPRYWGTRSLDYLWKGIGAYCGSHPKVRYLFGTVSISANYPPQAIDYLVAFFGHYYHNEGFSIRSKNPYIMTNEKQDYFQQLFKNKDRQTAYSEMKSYLREMNLVVPTLFKHYSELCDPEGVVFTDFGVDTGFGDCVDGFVVIDLALIKKNKYARYIAPFISEKSVPPLIELPNSIQNDGYSEYRLNTQKQPLSKSF